MEKKLIAGTMRWGSWGAQMSTQQYADTITQWLECGVNDFDLANLYGDYSCEKEFGAALKHLEISRSSVKLISKMGIENPSAARSNSVKHYNYSKEHIVSWVLKHPLVASCVIGTSRIDRILEVRRALDLDLELQDYFKLWESARGTKVP